MSWVIFFFGSGLAFFAGIALVLGALAAFSLTKKRWLHSLALLGALTGLILIALSATPLPYAYYSLAGVVTLTWLVLEELKPDRAPRARTWLRRMVAVVWLAGVAVELPHQLSPVLETNGGERLFIIGDSVAAGLGTRNEETWPLILAKKYGIEVHDFSHVGATAGSALKQANRLPPAGGVVLLEIGGNDVLGSTSAAKFEEDLDRLLERVQAPDRQVLMFELPLPPFQNDYGHSQRRLAGQYGVRMIPRRIFAAVLTAGGATLDSVHLSSRGHERMAQAVATLLGVAAK